MTSANGRACGARTRGGRRCTQKVGGGAGRCAAGHPVAARPSGQAAVVADEVPSAEFVADAGTAPFASGRTLTVADVDGQPHTLRRRWGQVSCSCGDPTLTGSRDPDDIARGHLTELAATFERRRGRELAEELGTHPVGAALAERAAQVRDATDDLDVHNPASEIRFHHFQADAEGFTDTVALHRWGRLPTDHERDGMLDAAPLADHNPPTAMLPGAAGEAGSVAGRFHTLANAHLIRAQLEQLPDSFDQHDLRRWRAHRTGTLDAAYMLTTGRRPTVGDRREFADDLGIDRPTG